MILECSGYTHSPRPVESIGDKVYIVNNLLVESDVNSQMLHRNGPGPVGVVLVKYRILDFCYDYLTIQIFKQRDDVQQCTMVRVVLVKYKILDDQPR